MNCFTRRQAESKWEYDHFIVAFFVALYSIFIFSGLAHLICAYTHNSCSNIGYLIPSWEMSVFALVTAHFLHSVHCWGGSYSIFFFSFSFMIIIIMEETSLSYDGIIFGKYTFSNEMGSRITPNLPLLVPMCWISLIYPTFLLTNVLIRGQPLVMPEPKNVFGSAILGSILLTAFDLVSEPIHTLYGHALWHHAAFVDSRTPLDTYQLLIDWKFEPNQAFQYYYDIPVQNFTGWLLSGFVIFSFTFAIGAMRPFSSTRPQKICKGFAEMLVATIPVILGLFCAQLYLVLHPTHPLIVRMVGGGYIVVLGGSMLLKLVYY